MRTIKTPSDTTSISIAGMEYTVDADGYADVSEEHAKHLITMTGFVYEDRPVVGADPVAAESEVEVPAEGAVPWKSGKK